LELDRANNNIAHIEARGELKDLVCDRVDREGFIGNPDVAHQVPHFSIGDLARGWGM
jgi:hypothetical protein